MAYIGKEPTTGNFIYADDITTSATNTYNILVGGVAFSPESANHLIVSLNGVIQKANTSFSVSGSQITFIPSSGTLSSSDSIDFILILGSVNDVGVATTVSDSAITKNKLNLISDSSSAGLTVKGDGSSENGTLQLNCSQNSHGVKISSPAHSAGQSYELILPTGNVTADKVLKVASVSGSGTTGIGQLSFGDAGGGLEMLDMWYTTSNQDITSDTGTVATNWARVVETGFGQIGSGMTHSSGIFTFPATGYYLVVFNGQFYTSLNSGENRSIEAQLEYTTNNASYGSTSTGRTNTSNTGASTYAGAYTEFVFDITDVSNQKVRTKVYGNQGFKVIGATSDRVYTSIRFMKLANT
tara:strand:+ start:201 stop:1265 length:1065 start_codon:yes stop_codon:yes gene_type:complete